jgi:hypothetical protein
LTDSSRRSSRVSTSGGGEIGDTTGRRAGDSLRSV